MIPFSAVPALSSSANWQIGHLANGPSFDIVENKGYLYVAQGAEVRIYNAQDINKISQLTWKDYISKIYSEYLVKALYIDSNYLYIASTNKFIISDISNPFSPSILSNIKNPEKNYGAEFRDIEIKGNYAFLTNYGNGVTVVDISNKTNPVVINTIKLKGYNRPWRLAVSGSNLYVTSETDNRLDIFDITNPANPAIKGSWSANAGLNSFSGVAIRGNYAYVTEYHNGIHVIDISNPSYPFELTKLMNMNANDIKILGSNAYVSIRYQGFNILDISNPANMYVVGKGTNIGGYNEGIFPTLNYVFLSAESKGFAIFSTSDRSSPGLLAEVPVIGGADSVTVKNNYMYIGCHNDGIWVADINDPSNPIEVAYIQNGGRNSGISIQNNYLYVAGEWAGLNVIDITNPLKPDMKVYDYGVNIGNVLPDGNYLYTSAGIVDITTPVNPVYVSRSDYMDGKFAKYGQNYLLSAVKSGNFKGLHVLDVTNKLNIIEVSTYNPGTVFDDVAVVGNTAIALSGNDIFVIDLSNPANPIMLSKLNYDGEWTGRSIYVNDKIAFAAGGPNGAVRELDISNPYNINLIRTFNLSEIANSIYFNNEKLFIASGNSGTYIVSPSSSIIVPSTTTTTVLSITTATVLSTTTTTVPSTKITSFNMRQWAIIASASSQYSSTSWSAAQATGSPDVLSYGDNPKAWATLRAKDSIKWIETGYSKRVYANGVNVLETYNPGALIRVDLKDSSNIYHTVWKGSDPSKGIYDKTSWSNITFSQTAYLTDTVRLYFENDLVPGWNEIDAVELIGAPASIGKNQWANSAIASSQYSSSSWSAAQATGLPDVLNYGDMPLAWAPLKADDSIQWIELNYLESIYANSINVLETNNPGALIKVDLKDSSNIYHTVWEGSDPGKGIYGKISWSNITFSQTAYLTNSVRLFFDTNIVPGWNEIDAVELMGIPNR